MEATQATADQLHYNLRVQAATSSVVHAAHRIEGATGIYERDNGRIVTPCAFGASKSLKGGRITAAVKVTESGEVTCAACRKQLGL